MRDSIDCDCGICGICDGTKKPLPPQKEGTHKWQARVGLELLMNNRYHNLNS
jgi:hypothetical protein